MITFGARSVAAILLCMFVGSAYGQDDHAKEKTRATEQTRQVAKSVKQCPPAGNRASPPNSQCFSAEANVGSAVNVIWDVMEGTTARAPYQGVVEFDLAGAWSLDQLQPTDKKVAKACDRNIRTESELATIWAKAMLRAVLGLPDDVEVPRSKIWHYRFEFDVGSDDPEVTKMLWTDETGRAQPVTFGYSCWVKAAQSVGSSKMDAPKPHQEKER